MPSHLRATTMPVPPCLYPALLFENSSIAQTNPPPQKPHAHRKLKGLRVRVSWSRGIATVSRIPTHGSKVVDDMSCAQRRASMEGT